MLRNQRSDTVATTTPKAAAERKYPSRVIDVSYGKALVAARDLQAGTVVEKFVGRDVDYNTLSDHDKTYVLNYQPPGSTEWRWLLAESDAKYANHSCSPNCTITPNQEIKTLRDVSANEELTFTYNIGDESDWWDPVWSFKCQCGSGDVCQGMIDQYRPSKSS